MWQAAATPRPSTHMPSAQHVRSVNVKKFEFTRARTRPATRPSPRAPPQSRHKGPWGAERPTRRTAVKAPRPGHDMCWLCIRREPAVCSRGSCCPRVASILRRFSHGPRPIHDRPETALCAARAPPRRRVGLRVSKRVFAKYYAFAPNIGVGRRRRSADPSTQRRAGSAAFP